MKICFRVCFFVSDEYVDELIAFYFFKKNLMLVSRLNVS